MKNKYSASCKKCGRIVQVGAGQTNMVNGKWETEHLSTQDCDAAVSSQASLMRSDKAALRSSELYRRPMGGGYNDYYDFMDSNDFMYFGGSSEDVNPNEGCK